YWPGPIPMRAPKSRVKWKGLYPACSARSATSRVAAFSCARRSTEENLSSARGSVSAVTAGSVRPRPDDPEGPVGRRDDHGVEPVGRAAPRRRDHLWGRFGAIVQPRALL